MSLKSGNSSSWLLGVCVCAGIVIASGAKAADAQLNTQLQASTAQSCTDSNWTKPLLLQLARKGFEVADAERDALAERLAACLAEADPELRDGIGFTGLSHWLRAGALSEGRIRSLYINLSQDVSSGKNSSSGVYLPFAVLTLSELARVDRVKPYLTDNQRGQLVTLATSHMHGISDYRGFDDAMGWRHQVAHAADLLLQLGLNPALDGVAIQALVNAIDNQISPKGHFYIFGEPERLARPVLYAMLREDIPEAFWREKISIWTKPVHIEGWEPAFSSSKGLAERHNRRAFLGALLLAMSASQNTSLQTLTPLVRDAFNQLP
ncbi:DUF2785 domain-containing protein [Shewanella cyperi]|uniref:DUF2785 domain-containing protein n=1 Tax=Shewanella cyperi TaxID=2814292 RepID=A0A975AKJ5_9GAMM|nr:DUF2785 domain-containing protein [Shewanella cyperi]QSX29268.1 DUF2785 domain-containing protein [Shewanella cyperi]